MYTGILIWAFTKIAYHEPLHAVNWRTWPLFASWWQKLSTLVVFLRSSAALFSASTIRRAVLGCAASVFAFFAPRPDPAGAAFLFGGIALVWRIVDHIHIMQRQQITETTTVITNLYRLWMMTHTHLVYLCDSPRVTARPLLGSAHGWWIHYHLGLDLYSITAQSSYSRLLRPCVQIKGMSRHVNLCWAAPGLCQH